MILRIVSFCKTITLDKIIINMKLTKELVDEIVKIFENLEIENKFEISLNDLKVGETEVIIFFPRDDVQIPVSDLMKYIPDLTNLDLSEERASSPRFTQMPVTSSGRL